MFIHDKKINVLYITQFQKESHYTTKINYYSKIKKNHYSFFAKYYLQLLLFKTY